MTRAIYHHLQTPTTITLFQITPSSLPKQKSFSLVCLQFDIQQIRPTMENIRFSTRISEIN